MGGDASAAAGSRVPSGSEGVVGRRLAFWLTAHGQKLLEDGLVSDRLAPRVQVGGYDSWRAKQRWGASDDSTRLVRIA